MVVDTSKMNLVEEVDFGNVVICDQCNDDYTDSKESGGFIFGSHAYCPKCAVEALPRIKGYGEEKYIKCFCPPKMSFHDFIMTYRNGNNSMKIYEE